MPTATPHTSRASLPRPFARATRSSGGRILSVLVLTSVVTACGASGPSSHDPEGVDLQHVHALEVDAADPDRLLLGTHQGLASWTASEGIRMVGDLRSDFMGFAVGPDGTYYASGHPAPDEDGPMSLGLIASQDQGDSWRDVSLSGEADFHALAASSAGVVGFDAANGLLRISPDGREWSDVPTGVGFVDLAADAGSGRVVGTTPEGGVVESADAGRTFTVVEDAPRLGYLDFTTNGELMGIDEDGRVSRQAADGTWVQADAPAPEGVLAVAAGGSDVLWVLTEAGLSLTEDGGDSFSEVASW